MGDQIKNFMIGLFVIAAIAVIAFILMFLHPRIGDEGKLLRARFTDIDKITIGTRVTYAGRPVGEVIDIQEVETGRDGPVDSGGRIYIYELTLRVDSSVDVYTTDQISLRTSGLLGEKNVEISPLAPKRGQEAKKIDQLVIFAAETGTVEETFKELKEVANKLDTALDAFTNTIYRVRDLQLIEKITHTVENIESITGNLNRPEVWKEILANVHHFSQHLNFTLGAIDNAVATFKESFVTFDRSFNTFNLAAARAKEFFEGGNSLLGNLSAGQGSLGKILSTEDLYLRFNSIMSKLETTLDDINHYGLLFHSDKGWQRLRARRLNLLQKLSTPQEFRNYFNDEIDQISTSLSRVYMVWNEINTSSCCYDLMQDQEFTKVFAELMRRISMLEEEVRLYNTQVVEAQVHTTELDIPCCER